jgi:subtilisin family serine protease
MKNFFLLYIFFIVAIIMTPFFIFATPVLATVFLNADSTLANSNGLIVKLKNSDRLYKLTDLQLRDPDFLLTHYQDNVSIEFVEPNFTFQAALLPNDPDFIQQYYLKIVQAPVAWDISTGKAEVVVAVLDSGVDIDNPDLKHNIWVNVNEKPFDQIDNDGNGKVDDFYGWNFVDDTNNIRPQFENFSELGVNHGTIVSGILSARGNNAQGIAGAAWQIKVMPLKVLDSSGYGDSLSVVEAIDYAIAKKVDVINLSVVGHNFSQALQNALQRAWNAGIVIVAATGNEIGSGQDMDVYPAYPVCNDGSDNIIIGVVALDRENRLANFSNYGSRCSDIAAPGVNFFSTVAYNETYPGFNHYYKGGYSGTSVATPLISALAALVKSVNPALSNVQIRNIILNTSTNIDNVNTAYQGQLGTGLVDFARALGAAQATLGTVSKPVSQDWLVVGAGAGGGPHVRVLDWQGNVLSQFFAYSEKFRGGVQVASGDVDGDGAKEIVTGAGAGGGPHIKIFNTQGQLENQFFAYEQEFRGGVNVAVGDIDGDGVAEIITAPLGGKEAVIKIFDSKGAMRFKFLAYADNFFGGASLAVGDVEGDGGKEIVTGAGPGGGPHVRVFSRQGKILNQFFAYAENFRGGVQVAVGDMDDNGTNEIVTGPGPGGGPQVRIFSSGNKVLKQFFVFDPETRTGLQLSVGDIDGDGNMEIITAPTRNAVPEVRVFNYYQELLKIFTVFSPAFSGGVRVDTLLR